MKSEDIIKDIAIYLGETELLCKHCGTVNPVADVRIETSYTASHKASYHAHCPECDGHIKKMRQDKKNRVFWKGSMITIGEFDSSLLLWILQKEYCKSDRVNDAITDLLWERLEIPNIKDFNPTIREMKIAEWTVKLKDEEKQLAEREYRIKSITHDIISEAAGWSSGEMQKQTKILKALRSSVKMRKRNLEEIKDTLDKLHKNRSKVKPQLPDVSGEPLYLRGEAQR